MKERVKGRLEDMYEENGEYCIVVIFDEDESEAVLGIPAAKYWNLKREFDKREKPIAVYMTKQPIKEYGLYSN